MAMNSGLRSLASKLTNPAIMPQSVKRGIHSSSVKKMSGGHGHGDEPSYIHATHMYNLHKVRHQKFKMTLAVFSAFSIGVFVPIFAVRFQQKKAASA